MPNVQLKETTLSPQFSRHSQRSANSLALIWLYCIPSIPEEPGIHLDASFKTLLVWIFFNDPVDVGNWISCSSPFYKTSLNIWKFTVHVLLKPGLENFEHYFISVWDESNCAVVWAFFGIAFLWDWNENWPFPVLWPLLSFPNLLAYWVQHYHNIIF